MSLSTNCPLCHKHNMTTHSCESVTTPKNQTADQWPKSRIEFLRSLSEPWRYLGEEDVLMLCDVALNGLNRKSEVDALKAQMAEKDAEIDKLSKLAAFRMDTAVRATDECNEAREKLTAAHSRIEKLREALEEIEFQSCEAFTHQKIARQAPR